MQNVDFGGFLESLHISNGTGNFFFQIKGTTWKIRCGTNSLSIVPVILFLFPQHFFDALVSTFCETQLPISDTRIDRKCCFFVVFCS